jgi:hypothetical protein
LTQHTLLGLEGTKVTDAGMEYLKGLTQLSYLYLAGTKVGGGGLEHLKGLTPKRKWILLRPGSSGTNRRRESPGRFSMMEPSRAG